MLVSGWTVTAAEAPMVLVERDEVPLPGDAIVEVAGCGVCHTDLGFYYEGVPTRHGFPIVLGHEISGVVVDAGAASRGCIGRKVVVPAVMAARRHAVLAAVLSITTCPVCNTRILSVPLVVIKRSLASVVPRKLVPGVVPPLPVIDQ